MSKSFQIPEKKTENLYICIQNCARLQNELDGHHEGNGGKKNVNEFSQEFREVYTTQIADKDRSIQYTNIINYSRYWHKEVYVNLILQRVQRQFQNIIIRSLRKIDMETIIPTLQPLVDIARQKGQKVKILQSKITKAMIEHVIESHGPLKKLDENSKVFLYAENWSAARKRGKIKVLDVISHENLNNVALSMGESFPSDNKEITILTAMITITFSDEFNLFPLIEDIFKGYCEINEMPVETPSLERDDV